MTMRTTTSLYDTYEDAVRTVGDLEAAGIPENDISIIANRDASPAIATVEEPRHAASGAATGATVGAAVGAGAALLAGLGILAIPGIGPVVAAGWLRHRCRRRRAAGSVDGCRREGRTSPCLCGEHPTWGNAGCGAR
jgi:hypothetical protein